MEQQIRRRTLLRRMHVNLHLVNNNLTAATTLPFSTAGEDVITELAELTKQKDETKQPECAKDTQLKQCGHELVSYNRLLI